MFGRNKETQEIKKFVHFPVNNLVITAVDVKKYSPIDHEVIRNLKKFRNVSLDMTNKTQEAKVRHEAEEQD